MRRVMVVVMVFGCAGHGTISTNADAAASADAEVDATGVPCRAPTIDGGIEYDCIFADELGICAGGGAYPTCHQRCSTDGAACAYGLRPHDVVVSDGRDVCYCE